jgi:hypothetical protein
MHISLLKRLLAPPTLVAVFLAMCGITVVLWIAGSSQHLLVSEAGSDWILYDDPPDLQIRASSFNTALFRRRFVVGSPPPDAKLTVRNFRVAVVFLDGKRILEPEKSFQFWKHSRIVDLTDLSPGEHELRIQVLNQNGPPALLSYCLSLGIKTDSTWEASVNGLSWTRARTAGERRPMPLSRKFPASEQAWVSKLWLWAAAFGAVFVLTLCLEQVQLSTKATVAACLTPSLIRWSLLGAWALLIFRNLFRLPGNIGFDAADHLEYIRYVENYWRPPLASEGWQMFQAPLYYFFSALFLRLLDAVGLQDNSQYWLRLIPVACGMFQVQLSYITTRTLFPGRPALQILGVLLGGLCPMNLYLSQTLGNEAFAGCLSSLALVAMFKIEKSRELSEAFWHCVRLGILIGLSLLAKVSAVLLILPISIYLAFQLSRNQTQSKTMITKLLAAILVSAGLVAGSYYLPNWIESGSPAVLSSSDRVWWQEPGFRTPSHFLSFGEALTYPIFSASTSFWDGYYSTLWADGYLSSVIEFEHRPPWHYDFMLASSLFALLPTAAILIGGMRSLIGTSEERWAARFSLACLTTYILAMLYVFASLPFYSVAKATYSIGILPCYVALGVYGLDWITRRQKLRAAIYGLMACWGISSYFSYLI